MTKQKTDREKILVSLESQMVTKGLSIALCSDFEVHSYHRGRIPAIEDFKECDLAILDAQVSHEGLREVISGIKKEGRPPILWIAAKNDQKPSGGCLVMPFDRARLLEKVCESLKIKLKTLEDRRAIPTSQEGSEPVDEK